MSTMTLDSVRATSSIVIRQPKPAHYKITAKKGLLRRFQRFIVSTDWEDRYFCNRFIDKACLAGIIVSVLYFLPFMIFIVQR